MPSIAENYVNGLSEEYLGSLNFKKCLIFLANMSTGAWAEAPEHEAPEHEAPELRHRTWGATARSAGTRRLHFIDGETHERNIHEGLICYFNRRSNLRWLDSDFDAPRIEWTAGN